MPAETTTAYYLRYYEHVRRNNGYPILLGGTLIGALRNHSLFAECAETKHQTGLVMYDAPDIDVVVGVQVKSAGDVPAFNATQLDIDLDNDGVWRPALTARAAGYLYPLLTQPQAPVGSQNAWGVVLYVEEWNYMYNAEEETYVENGVEGSAGGFCPKAFELRNLIRKDVGFGAIPAEAYVFKGSEKLLEKVFGNWYTLHTLNPTSHPRSTGA
jgi:hypothetical protein